MTNEERYNKYLAALDAILNKTEPTAAELALVAKHLRDHKIEPPPGGTEKDRELAGKAATRLPFGEDARDA